MLTTLAVLVVVRPGYGPGIVSRSMLLQTLHHVFMSGWGYFQDALGDHELQKAGRILDAMQQSMLAKTVEVLEDGNQSLMQALILSVLRASFAGQAMERLSSSPQ
jgi:hypothetical protein